MIRQKGKLSEGVPCAVPPMPARKRRISLLVFVVITLFLVGLFPLVLTGWFLSDKSGNELRSAENRYQIQLVQEKARQIEMFSGRFTSMVSGITNAFELSSDPSIISSPNLELRLGTLLRENPDLLAVHLTSASSEPLVVFRSGAITREEVERIGSDAQKSITAGRISIGDPVSLDDKTKSVITFGSASRPESPVSGSIVAIATLEPVSQSIVGISNTSEDELWEKGLPIIFVVDGTGKILFHPDRSLSASRPPATDLKIVQDWLKTGRQVQSALVPFVAEYNGKSHEMIGAYSTARLVDGHELGVITMQDESQALASVGEMRNQTWLISMAFAVLALLVGFVGSRLMTSPLLRLVEASKRIAAGDYHSRVETQNITEIGTLAESFNLMGETIEMQISKLEKAANENRELFVGTVKALAAAIDGKDKYTRGHSERVSRIAVAIGRRMGLGEDELETLRISALLHDVGKIAVDDAILKKPASLTDAEFDVMKTHPQKGYKIMSQIPAMKDYLPGIYMHHEMVNGQGYPQGLTADEIPLQAKIVSVADTFDAMIIDRPYQKGMELAPALERLRSFVGTRYQSDVVEALIDACNAGEVANGIVRQLANKRAADAEIKASTLDRLVA